MYADKMTDSMKFAISETNRRRKIQSEYNKANGIVPATIVKAIPDKLDLTLKDGSSERERLPSWRR